MNYKTHLAALLLLVLAVGTVAYLNASPTTATGYGFAEQAKGKAMGHRISNEDLGFLQVAAHDLFNVNRVTEIDSENQKLDLTTVLDHGFASIAIGGEFRNRENPITMTAAVELGTLYLGLLDQGIPPATAREETIRVYHLKLRQAFQRAFNQPFPKPKCGVLTQTHNLALRTVHDFLPDHIIHNGELVSIFTVTGPLNVREMQYVGSPLDGEYDAGFRDIHIPFPPFSIDLLERDITFATQFNTGIDFETDFLSTLEDGKYDRNDLPMIFINEAFESGLCLV